MPNATAYNETCANICNAMFSYRMLGLKGESKYADVMELVLYNSAMSGISADGESYFYTNPLRRTNEHKMDTTDYATRADYIDCFCCPPNLARTIAKVSGWAYSLSGNGVAVNLYGGNVLNSKLADGSAIRVVQSTDYPWDGRILIRVEECKPEAFDFMLRIPAWTEGAKITVNGEISKVVAVEGSYAVLNRKWRKGDVITLDIPLETKLMEGHRLIEEVRNQVSIKRGPVVYCVETPDLPEGTSVLDVFLPSDLELKPKYDKNFLGGLTRLYGDALFRDTSSSDMYRTLGDDQWKTVETAFIPYYAWSNRGEAEMTVWMPVVWQ